MKSPLRWVGGKQKAAPKIIPHLDPNKELLVVPFVGAGNVFINTDYENYYLTDTNQSLIWFYKCLYSESGFIDDVEEMFNRFDNTEEDYYKVRYFYNKSADEYKKTIYFYWLNRHSFRGLSRYNSNGLFNVPYGHLKTSTMNKNKLLQLRKFIREKNIVFDCSDFRNAITYTSSVYDSVQYYCDPPYLNTYSNYSSTDGFTEHQHKYLAAIAYDLSKSGNYSFAISNIESAKYLYENADYIVNMNVTHSVSMGENKLTGEILAVYS